VSDSFPYTRWNLTDLYQYLGSQEIPGIAAAAVLPIAIVADYSEAATGEAALARAVAGQSIGAAAGEYGAFQLFAPGRAVVVEHMRVRLASGVNAVLSFGISGKDGIPSGNTIPFSAVSGNTGGCSIGGVQTTAVFTWGRVNSLLAITAQFPISTATPNDLPSTQPFRAYIPPGESLLCAFNIVNSASHATVIWREIAGRL
jgi:hypothetical protein